MILFFLHMPVSDKGYATWYTLENAIIMSISSILLAECRPFFTCVQSEHMNCAIDSAGWLPSQDLTAFPLSTVP